MALHKPTGPHVQFVVVQKRWVTQTNARPEVGGMWCVDGDMCRVLAVVDVGGGRVRAFVEPVPVELPTSTFKPVAG